MNINEQILLLNRALTLLNEMKQWEAILGDVDPAFVDKMKKELREQYRSTLRLIIADAIHSPSIVTN